MIEAGLKFRNAEPSDRARILAVMPEWWGGRDLTAMLHELFFEHCSDTCFVAERGKELVGFLVGFLSQAHPEEAYIHFVGVHPEFRKGGVGTQLYERLFEVCRRNNRKIIKGCTSPVNTGSIAYHARIGFEIEQGAEKVYFMKRLD